MSSSDPNKEGEEHIPEARKTHHMPGHIKARPPFFGKAGGGATPQIRAATRFFESPYFAVAGASTEERKFGYKLLAWYHDHDLPVTAINPKEPTISIDGRSYKAITGPAALKEPESTSLSVVCAPPVTKVLLKEAKEAGIKAVWLQPGTYDDEVLKYADEEFEASVAGMEGGTVGGEGWCVLVDGEKSMKDAGRASEKL